MELLFQHKGGLASFGTKVVPSFEWSCMNSITESACRAKYSNILHDSTVGLRTAKGASARAREALLKGKDQYNALLVLASLDELVLILQSLFTFFTKQAHVMRKKSALSLPL